MKMNSFLISIFAIFLGSQITEGVLLVPYWQSLPAEKFYEYYHDFGPSLGRFYTPLTIVATLISIVFAVFSFLKKSPAFRYFFISALFSIGFILCFYFYFKGANELFYQASLSESELKQELVVWSQWHWGRVGLEFLGLLFLIFGFQKLENE